MRVRRLPNPLFVAILSLVFLAGCGGFERRLDYAHQDSRAMGAPMEYAVWTPPDFRPTERLPLVLFLHGGGDDAASFDRHAVAADLDQAVRTGGMPRVVVVLPDGELGFWENWDDRTRFYQDWVTEELLPHVAARYHTLPCPDGCHVLGNSMGGAGTLRFALRRPDIFSSAGILSGPVFDTDSMVDFVEEPSIVHLFVPVHRIWGTGRQRSVIANDDPFVRWRSQADTGLDRIYVAWAAGDRDGIVDTSKRLRAHLSEHAIEHAWEEFEGGHNWVSWRPVITRAIAYQVGGPTPARR